jgi:hypothetical protein
VDTVDTVDAVDSAVAVVAADDSICQRYSALTTLTGCNQ